MNKTSKNRDNNLSINALLNTFSFAKLNFLITLVLLQTVTLSAQFVLQPISDISITMKKYVYTYNFDDASKKDIRYIIIKSSTGEIKSCFDACDVCYAANKGYSQKGTQLVCNNCGNKFNIDGLGSQGKGGCWPGHLVHSLKGTNVEFNKADLEKGAYLFPLLTTDIPEIQNDKIRILIDNNNFIRVNVINSKIKNFEIYTINGTICKTYSDTDNSFNVDISDLPSGLYIITYKIDGNIFSKKFNIIK